LLARCGADSVVVRAVRDRAVCMVNPFRCKVLYKKASLAVLSDERNSHLFTDTEREAIAAHIPGRASSRNARHVMAGTTWT
jgi:hypothetical protein